MSNAKARKSYEALRKYSGCRSSRVCAEVLRGLHTDGKIRGLYSRGWGSHTKVENLVHQTLSVLEALHLVWYIGNDAPRGGQLGWFVQIMSTSVEAEILRGMLREEATIT